MIQPEFYKSISDNINDMQKTLQDHEVISFGLIENINLLSEIYGFSESSLELDIDFLNELSSSMSLINDNSNTFESSKYINDFMRSLQNHILKYFTNIDSYLSHYNIKVKVYFANLSSSLGYTISSSNIEE